MLDDGALRDERLAASARERLRTVERGTTAERAAHRPCGTEQRGERSSSCALNHRPEHTHREHIALPVVQRAVQRRQVRRPLRPPIEAAGAPLFELVEEASVPRSRRSMSIACSSGSGGCRMLRHTGRRVFMCPSTSIATHLTGCLFTGNLKTCHRENFSQGSSPKT